MKRRLLCVLALVAVALTAPLQAAGTVTVTYGSAGAVRWVKWTWTSDASGDANGTNTAALSGVVLRVVTNPGATAPTDDWDAVINDADGVDIMAGALANRDTATSEQAIPVVQTVGIGHAAFSGVLSLVVSNAGNAKEGVVTLYYR